MIRVVISKCDSNVEHRLEDGKLKKGTDPDN